MLRLPYYRLTQRDNDGNGSESWVAAAQAAGTSGFAYLSENTLFVNGAGSLQLVALSGLVKLSAEQDGLCAYSVSQLEKGVYFVALNGKQTNIKQITVK